ncbi:MAG: hypothetical protein CVT88_04640 [Candidatus Altiarchaeales archaeon HGW-Altiarchaeales-1]|nr:MAG: hypothetical protein CVT88_04640 [Candidatus Altiarchaeales archaeon HGW-Altiarchaeales-1]
METVTLNILHKNIMKLMDDMAYLKHLLDEEYELSDWAKKNLKEARKTPDSEYISQEDMEKEFL